MTPEEYRQAGDLFERFRGLAQNEWAAALETACAGNQELRAQVLRLLEADRAVADSSFMQGRAIEDAARLLGADVRDLPASGTVMGNYRLGARIGAGGMGVVYAAEDLHLDRQVVVKILPQEFAPINEERIEHFQREARAASLLNHPNIVSIFDAGFDQGWHYIAMEYIEGKTLREVIEGEPRPLKTEKILDVIGQVAAALAAAHEGGIVHRDIKPENILVRRDGIVKVLDFGLAQRRRGTDGQDLRTKRGNLAGTIQYLSPEQILGEPAEPRSDIFSLGVVGYELASGVRPFDRPTDGAVLEAILNYQPPPPSALRASLGTELDAVIMRALEKDPDLRFQTAGDLRSFCRVITRDHVAKPTERQEGSRARQSARLPPVERDGGSGGVLKARLRVAAMALVAAGVALYFWLNRPLPAPTVTRIEQITNETRPIQYFVTDGTRIYYAAGNDTPDIKVFQVSVNGGEPVPMPRLTGMCPLGISPDGSQILLAQFLKLNTFGPYPLWVSDTLGSAPRRVGDLTADDATWSPKGDEILYTNGPELRIARRDGWESRRVVALPESVLQFPAWSPDGRSIRFSVAANNVKSEWEVSPDGANPHNLFPDWADRSPSEGIWTADGRYFIFSSQQTTRDLFAVRRRCCNFFGKQDLDAAQLTSGPMTANRPRPSPDGRRIYFIGDLDLGELVRYDPKLNEWKPYLGGLAATQLDYSRDGKWITYVSYPDRSVWRSAVDGSARMQLSEPPLLATNPRFSPDGEQITFFASTRGKRSRIYVVPAAGGAVEKLTNGKDGSGDDGEGNWSPDGRSLLFSASEANNKTALHMLDVKSRSISRLPGSEGLWSPRWSPDGRYVAVLDQKFKLGLYDLQTHEHTELTTFGAGFPSWSRDGQYLYFEDNATTTWYRVGIAGRRKVERVASLKDLKMAASTLGWVGLTPDGSLISTRDVGRTEIYALDWEAQ